MKKIFFTAGITLLLDGVSKLAVRRLLTNEIGIGSVIRLNLVENSGIAFGLFSGKTVFTLILPPLVVALGWLLLRKISIPSAGRIGAGMIVGGFAGNYAERLVIGSVTDWIYFPWLPWFVCNIADIAIVFGAAILFVTLLRLPGEKEEKDA